MVSIGIIGSVFTGNLGELNKVILGEASNAIEFTISIAGAMALWMGVMNIAKDSGLIERIGEKISGNYFDKELIEEDVAYSILLTEVQKESLPKTTIRRWTLGEIITTLAEEHFKIEKLVEEHGSHQRWVFPSTASEGMEERVPGLYTLIATACKKGSLHG